MPIPTTLVRKEQVIQTNLEEDQDERSIQFHSI